MQKIDNSFFYRIVLLFALVLVTHYGTNCMETGLREYFHDDPSIYDKICAAGACLSSSMNSRDSCCEMEQGPRYSCDYCSGKEHCERIKTILETADTNKKYQQLPFDTIARYCCDKFKICFINQYCSECYACKIAQKCNSKVEHYQRHACCKRGYGCDLPVFEPNPDSPVDKHCIDWTDGSCIPLLSIDRCCYTYGIGCKANVKICPEQGTYIQTSYTSQCFEDRGPDERPNCVGPRQWGHCCEYFGICNRPICDPEFWDNKTASLTYEAKHQQPEKLTYRVPEVRGYGMVRDG